MTEINGFRTKKEAKQYKRRYGGKLAYICDERGRSKNVDLYYIAVRFGHLDAYESPFCVYKEVPLDI